MEEEMKDLQEQESKLLEIRDKIDIARGELAEWLNRFPDAKAGGYPEGSDGHLQQASEAIDTAIYYLKK